MSRQLYLNFIKDNRWKYIVNGLGTTLQITFFAVILGIALGFLIAVIRSTYDKTGKGKILNFLAKVYLTVIRGTPVLVHRCSHGIRYQLRCVRGRDHKKRYHVD